MSLKPLACGFHAHSHFSLDGGSSIQKMVNRAKELGRTAMNLTDHGNMNGLADLHMCCSKAGLTCIHGIELYVINEQWSPPKEDGKPTFRHLTVHFRTQKAYEWFCQKSIDMEKRAVTIFGERKTILHWHELLEISNEIVLGSGCLGSFVMNAVRIGNFDLAERIYQELRSSVPKGMFFAEIFPHRLVEEWQKPKWEKGLRKMIEPGFFKPNDPDPECGHAPKDTQRTPNMFILRMAEKYGDPVIVSEDSHLSDETEYSTQNIKMGRGADSWRFSVPYAMRSIEYWEQHLIDQLGENQINRKKIEEFVDNSYQFVSLFENYKFETAKDRWVLPTTEIVFGDTYPNASNKEILKKLIIAGGRMPMKGSPQFKEYVDRLAYEVSVLSDNGKLDLLPYFFVLADLVKWARENGRVCQARGSAGGSLVAYLLGITITDPIKWDLQFERFLTLGRILANTLPDIDADFDVKDVVMSRLSEKYGDKLSKISINTLLKVKSSIRDVERVELGEVRDTTETLCRKLPNIDQGIDPISWLNGYEDKDTGAWVPGFIEDKSQEAEMLRDYMKNNPKFWEEVQKCLGIVRQKSAHACGIILADDRITKYTPMTMVGDELITGYCPKGCEYKGLVKFDILGVKTLEACRVAMASIKEHAGVHLVWEEFPHDPEVYDYIIGNRMLQGIFQIGTDTMRPFVLSLSPKTTNELSNLVALVRPGTLDALVKVSPSQTLTASEVFVQCAQGKRSPRFIHPDLKSILESTYGILLFQEQALRIFRDIGGFSYEKAEVARRGIGKKDKALLAQELGKLAANIRDKGTWTEEQINELCDTIIASARYSFNKSHSAAYAVVAYNCMYLKYHFPVHFYRGLLEVNNDDHDEIREIMKEAGSSLILPPDVLKSHPTEWSIENGTKLRAPLCLIKGVGSVTANEIKEFLTNGVENLAKKEPKEPKKATRKKKGGDNERVAKVSESNQNIQS